MGVAVSGGSVVLLVEDDDDHAELIERGFERANVPVRLERVRDGDAATVYLQAASETELEAIATIIIDLRLPKKSGLELLAELKQAPSTSAIPAVVFTSSRADSDLHAAYAANANSYLVKPIAPTGFNAVVESLAKYWVDYNER